MSARVREASPSRRDPRLSMRPPGPTFGASRRGWIARAGLLILLALRAPLITHAQQLSNVYLESNEQLFSILAALNLAGYDAGFDLQNREDSFTGITLR